MKVLIFLLVIIFAAHSFADDKKKDPNKKDAAAKMDVGDSFCFQHIQQEYDAQLGSQAWKDQRPQSKVKKTLQYIGKNLAFVVGFGTSALMPVAKGSAGEIIGGIDTGGIIGQLTDERSQNKQKRTDNLGWVMNTIKQAYNFDDGDYDADNDDRDGVIRFSAMVRAAWQEGKPTKCDKTDGTCEVVGFPHYDPEDDDAAKKSDENIADDIRTLDKNSDPDADDNSKKPSGKVADKEEKPEGRLCQLVNNKGVKDPNDKAACIASSKGFYSPKHPCQHWEFMPIPDLVYKIIEMERDRKKNYSAPAPAAPPNNNPPPTGPPCHGSDCIRSI